MEIRYTSPIVFTNDATKIIKQMEALGFHTTHAKEDAGGTNVISCGIRCSISQVDPQDKRAACF